MNKQIRKKLEALSLVAAISMSLLTGCGNSAEDIQSSTVQTSESQSSESQSSETVVDDGFEHDPVLNELGAETICNEKVKLTIGVAQSLKVEDYETNYYT